MAAADPDASAVGRHRWRPPWTRHPSVIALLAVVALIPTAGILVVSVNSASSRIAAERTAGDIDHRTDALGRVLSARVAVTDENVATSALAAAHDAGLQESAIVGLIGIDYPAKERQARAEVDAAAALRTGPLAVDRDQLLHLRPAFDAGKLSLVQVTAAFSQVMADIDAQWRVELADLRHVAVSATGSARFGLLVENLDEAFRAWTAALATLGATNDLLTGTRSPSAVMNFLTVRAEYNDMASVLSAHLGPHAGEAWRALLRDPAAGRFQYILSTATAVATEGVPSPYASDFPAYGQALADGARWVTAVQALVREAAADVRDQADSQQSAARRALWIDLGFAISVAVLAFVAAVWVSRRVSRSLLRVAASARALAEGSFHGEPCPTTGPGEIARTAEAVNDTTSALRALEGYVVTLADDPASPLLDTPLPGPMGRALQRTLDRLRASMTAAAEHRRQLQELASHDGLTGLFNRASAVDVVGHQLALARRQALPLMVLFVDLDNLKSINDTYGHSTGDEALKAVAGAFRATARASDVIARMGGDEFLVAGVAQQGLSDATTMAERMRVAVSEQVLEVSGETISLSCSIGVALVRPGDVLEEAIGHADAALYAAKERGRNRVAVYEREDHLAQS